MDKDNLYAALYLLMCKLDSIKASVLQDKTFVMALTEVLRYFKDTGDLKEAFKYQKTLIQDMQNQAFYKSMIDMFCSKVSSEHPEMAPPNIDEFIERQFSDEYIENKINSILDIHEDGSVDSIKINLNEENRTVPTEACE